MVLHTPRKPLSKSARCKVQLASEPCEAGHNDLPGTRLPKEIWLWPPSDNELAAVSILLFL